MNSAAPASDLLAQLIAERAAALIPDFCDDLDGLRALANRLLRDGDVDGYRRVHATRRRRLRAFVRIVRIANGGVS